MRWLDGWAAKISLGALVALGALGLSAWSQQPPAPIDFNKARAIRERVLKGEAVSAEDRAYFERAKAAIQKKQGPRPIAAPRDSLGLVPLTDLKGEARYKDQDGGLYGGGRNEPSDKHLEDALRAAGRVRPLDAQGHPARDGQGKIGLVAIGMSNTTQEFQRFLELARDDPKRSPAVALVDGAQGGMEASMWADPEKSAKMGRPDPWAVLDRRLAQAKLAPKQVQVVWIKQARANPAALGAFPAHAEALKEDLAIIARKLKQRFPNLQLAYLSSRIYGGYASTPLNPEPYAYESAFAIRWLIRDQDSGKLDLNHDPAGGDARAPVLLWGPYLWADGVKGRKADALVWTREDLGPDGTHPGPSGRLKVAEQLARFFHDDPTARPWYARADLQDPKAPARAAP